METAAHLTDHVFSSLPVRQWVLLVPKRLCHFMQRDGPVLNMVLRIFCGSLRNACNPTDLGWRSWTRRRCTLAQLAFIHRFGSSLNGHVHFHVCVFDGIFEEVELFHWTTLEPPLVADRF